MGLKRFLRIESVRKKTIRSRSRDVLLILIPVLFAWIGIDYLTEGQLGGIADEAADLIAEIAESVHEAALDAKKK
jgi:hypothetical protein